MKSQSLVPKLTRPTTAYALLSNICKLITEEPKRYYQRTWIDLADLSVDKGKFPACGTMGCVAGWVETLRSSSDRAYDKAHALTNGGKTAIFESARRTLGLTTVEARCLFAAEALEDLHGGRLPVAAGTSGYAKFGVRHIRAFQQKHAKKLKAKIVKPERA